MLEDSLRAIGRDPVLLAEFVEFCRRAEQRLAKPDYNVRELVTGELIDAACADMDTVPVTLRSGISFELPYRSKIARDLVLRTADRPDHIFEPQTTRLLMHLCRDARNILIGGAYAGDHAVPVAALMQTHGGVVHAFEPNPELMAALKRNAALNNVRNIVTRSEGLCETDGMTLKLVGDDAWAHLVTAQPGEEGALRCTTIDAYGKSAGLAKLDVIMLDIEGSELAALRGAASYLAQSEHDAPDVIFEVNRMYVDWTDGLERTPIACMLIDFGYTLYGIRDYQSNVEMSDATIELVPADDIYLEGPPHGFNMLAVKNVRKITHDPAFRLTPGLSPKLLTHRDPRLHAPSSPATARA